ncbi:glucosidase 2 subunit beta-like [Eurosta solidaginis]|uniref:glucosidase 2 subunit beta-like n=1 Tax=Eurosta solidaginis TaxID=178769 RepID=UPI0035317DA1
MLQLYLYKKLAIVFLILTIVMAVAEPNTLTLRGVPPVKATLYALRSGKSWVCLDNRKTLKYEQVNDDYCDCDDGSDEPGTSACPNGHFSCANIGHRSENIHSSRVNDGICDCCDGSDEWAETFASCQNTCLELGRIEEEQKRSRTQLQQLGGAKRLELIAKGKQLRLDREEHRKALVQERNEHEAIRNEKEELKLIAEKAEAEAIDFHKSQQRNATDNEPSLHEAAVAFVTYDTNNDGFVDITELLVDLPLDSDHNGIVTVEEARYYLGDNRERLDLNTFCTVSWPRIKSIKLLNEDIFKKPQHESVEQPANHEVPDQETFKEGTKDELEIYEDEEVEANSLEAKVTPRDIEYDEETKRLMHLAIEARNVYLEEVQKVRQIEQEIQNVDDQAAKDYGPNEEFATLDGQCFSYEDREYVYELCPFVRALQRSKSTYLETKLGRWDRWISGDGDKKHEKQKYAHGAACWNGPKRSCIVHFICGLEQKITAVTEPNRCEYSFVFETPAACDSNAEIDKQHDEL